MTRMNFLSNIGARASAAGAPAALALVILTPVVPSAHAATISESGPVAQTTLNGVPGNSIIMRDGGICDPIRHMGC
jgi:hypothetical protein